MNVKNNRINNYPGLTQSDLDVIASYMDDELRESLHGCGYDIPGEFLTVYLATETTGELAYLLDTDLSDYVTGESL